MGEVYRARDSRLGRDVAIKLIAATFATEASRVHRFEQEARAAGQLNHPNILVVYDTGLHDGAPYIVVNRGETDHDRLATLRLEGDVAELIPPAVAALEPPRALA